LPLLYTAAGETGKSCRIVNIFTSAQPDNWLWGTNKSALLEKSCEKTLSNVFILSAGISFPTKNVLQYARRQIFKVQIQADKAI
jgi:hypothetical protein